jgi:hypothetical protein
MDKTCMMAVSRSVSSDKPLKAKVIFLKSLLLTKLFAGLD